MRVWAVWCMHSAFCSMWVYKYVMKKNENFLKLPALFSQSSMNFRNNFDKDSAGDMKMLL